MNDELGTVDLASTVSLETGRLAWETMMEAKMAVDLLRLNAARARVQIAGIDQQKPIHELLAPDLERGLARLPEPSTGDIFFDLEGDPFTGLTGIEYLFGVASAGLDD